MPEEEKALFNSAAAPLRLLAELALMTPELSPSRVLRTEASRVLSLRVTASSPRPVMPEEV